MIISATPIFWGTLILLLVGLLFYIVALSLLFYWHEKKVTFVVVPIMFTFEFFIVGFLVLALAFILFQYFPEFMTFYNNTR